MPNPVYTYIMIFKWLICWKHLFKYLFAQLNDFKNLLFADNEMILNIVI